MFNISVAEKFCPGFGIRRVRPGPVVRVVPVDHCPVIGTARDRRRGPVRPDRVQSHPGVHGVVRRGRPDHLGVPRGVHHAAGRGFWFFSLLC